MLEPIAESITIEFLLGFFIALSLRRGRIEAVIDKLIPSSSEES
jgi:hypothetical protein